MSSRTQCFLGIRLFTLEPEHQLAEGSLAASRLSELLEALDAHPQSACSLWIPGSLAEALTGSMVDRIAARSGQNHLELLQGLFFTPAPGVATDIELELHFKRSRDFWQSKAAASVSSVVWLAETALQEDVVALLPADATHVVINRVLSSEPFLLSGGRELCCIPPGNGVGLDTGNIRILSLCLSNPPEREDGAWTQALSAIKDFDSRPLSQLPSGGFPKRVISELSGNIPANTWLHTAKILRRINDMRAELQALPKFIDNNPQNARNKLLLLEATNWFLRAQEQPPVPLNELSHHRQYLWMRACTAALLHARVEIDAITNAEIDPIEGWLKLETPGATEPHTNESGLTIVDNPFLRAYCSPAQGAIASLEYKPRKLELLGVRGLPEPLGALGTLVPADATGSYTQERPSAAISSGVTRSNPGMAVFRMIQPLAAAGWKGKLYKDFTFKAGLGAHLANSTTGFSLEYWLEAPSAPDKELLLSIDFPLMLPSGNPDGMSARLLLAVGGVSEHALSLSSPLSLTRDSHQCSLHGIRLIDGIEHWVIDFRSARPLDRIELFPLHPQEPESIEQDDVPSFGGLMLRLMLEAPSVWEDNRENVLFISIP